MERLSDILAEVLANTAKMVAERKALIREGSDEQRMLGAQLAGGSIKATGDDEGLKSNNVICAADHPRPVERDSHPKTARAELFCGERHAQALTTESRARMERTAQSEGVKCSLT